MHVAFCQSTKEFWLLVFALLWFQLLTTVFWEGYTVHTYVLNMKLGLHITHGLVMDLFIGWDSDRLLILGSSSYKLEWCFYIFFLNTQYNILWWAFSKSVSKFRQLLVQRRPNHRGLCDILTQWNGCTCSSLFKILNSNVGKEKILFI